MGGYADKYRGEVQGPAYQAANAFATNQFNQANSFDPNSAAADQYAKYQAMVAPQREKTFNDKLRGLQSQGLLGLSSYNNGLDNTQSMNPIMAAMFAANADADRKAAWDSMGQGQGLLNN